MSAKKPKVPDFNKPFAKRLLALMDNEKGISPLGRKVTQQELAEAIMQSGISIQRQTISNYINGKASPDLEKFQIIADYFGVSYDFLLGKSESLKRENIDISETTGLSDEAITFLRRINIDRVKILDPNRNPHFYNLRKFYCEFIQFSINAFLNDRSMELFGTMYTLYKIQYGFASMLDDIVDDDGISEENQFKKVQHRKAFCAWRCANLFSEFAVKLSYDFDEELGEFMREYENDRALKEDAKRKEIISSFGELPFIY